MANNIQALEISDPHRNGKIEWIAIVTPAIKKSILNYWKSDHLFIDVITLYGHYNILTN